MRSSLCSIPFGFPSASAGGEDNWSSTLGREHYDWLAATLAQSQARFRFVILHHPVGGQGKDARWVEAAPFYEWGGRNPDGADIFNEKRAPLRNPPDWLRNLPTQAIFPEHVGVFSAVAN